MGCSWRWPPPNLPEGRLQNYPLLKLAYPPWGTKGGFANTYITYKISRRIGAGIIVDYETVEGEGKGEYLVCLAVRINLLRYSLTQMNDTLLASEIACCSTKQYDDERQVEQTRGWSAPYLSFYEDNERKQGKRCPQRKKPPRMIYGGLCILRTLGMLDERCRTHDDEQDDEYYGQCLIQNLSKLLSHSFTAMHSISISHPGRQTGA